jgi:hypothetical protein
MNWFCRVLSEDFSGVSLVSSAGDPTAERAAKLSAGACPIEHVQEDMLARALAGVMRV